MKLSQELIAEARALAFYRKFKVRRALRIGNQNADDQGLPGWVNIGSGNFSEVWAHAKHPGLVVKISGRSGFGSEYIQTREPAMDGWPTFAQYCQAHPHPNLPRILHFERLSLGCSWGIMPRYSETDRDHAADEMVGRWADYLAGGQGAPKWMWPIIGMRASLGMMVDLHCHNVMIDDVTGEYIMTDPFSFVDSSSGQHTY